MGKTPIPCGVLIAFTVEKSGVFSAKKVLKAALLGYRSHLNPEELEKSCLAFNHQQNIVVDLHTDPGALPVWIRSRATGAQKRGANQLSYQGR